MNKKGGQTMRLTKPIIAIAVASSFVLAACGGDDGEGGSGNDNNNVNIEESGNTGRAQDPDREGPVTIEGAQEGGTIKVLSFAGLNTMDPTEAYYQNTTSILTGLVTRSLTQYVSDGEGGMTLVPDLAVDLCDSSEDFKTWTCEIREGITYEDGSPVEMEDFVWAAKRSMDREAFPEGAAYSNDYFLDENYGGPYSDPNGKFTSVTFEGNTLTYKMRIPFPDFPYWASFAAMGPIPEDASDPAEYAQRPLATGPYKFADYTPEKSLTLVRNDQWDPATDPGRTAYPDSYEFDFQTESDQIDQIIIEDSEPNVLTYDDVQASNFQTVRDTGRLVTGTFPLTSYWAPDYRKITDIKVRQALAWAYPYKDADLAGEYIAGVTSIPGTSLMPPGTAGRVDFNPIEGHDPGTTDAAAAKALLEEAGEVGYEIKWLYAKDDPTSVAVKDQVERALKEAGFSPKPVPTTIADFSTLRADPATDINVRSAGWIADWPSGSSWFPPVIQSTNLDKEGLGSNYAVFNEPAIDDKIDGILEMPLEEQADAWGALDEEVMTDYLPLFVIRYGGVAQAHNSGVQGMTIDNTIGMPVWKDLWLEQ